ncbi:MAG: hypothetical protein LIP08_07425, partial [Bacteroides sp.]|nr:hypothetical protein [Bacteroides sp.]
MGKVFKFSCVMIIAFIGLLGCSSSSDKSYELVHSHRITVYVSEHPIKFSYTTQEYGWHTTSDISMTVNGEEITDFEVRLASSPDYITVFVTIYKEYEIEDYIEVYIE